jgi:DEAD/DEAH box helicase domain-containing protein
MRVAHHYGSDPRFLLSSATIRNPGDLAERLVGAPVEVVDEDGAPRGPKLFAFWNPRVESGDATSRGSTSVEAERILVSLMRRDVQSIVFTRSRVAAELIYRYARERLERDHLGLAEKLSPYRGGYLPEERRAIERRLFDGDLKGVISTNALELGIDVGSRRRDLVGFEHDREHGQQAGRAGRSRSPRWRRGGVRRSDRPVPHAAPGVLLQPVAGERGARSRESYVLASQLLRRVRASAHGRGRSPASGRGSEIASLLEQDGA